MVRHDSDKAKLDLGFVFSEKHGERVGKFIEQNLVLESGQPFKLLPWQWDFIHSIYSWVHPDTGLRAVKLGLLTLGRKNGKSVLTYGLTAYHLLADNEQSPSCVSCAVDKEQAGQIFSWFKFAVESNRKLSNALHVVPTRKTIEYPARNGKYRSLASVAAGNFGHGHSFVIHDELAFHPKDDLYTALKNSTDARPNGLQLITSTAGWNKNGAFYKLVQYGRDILNNKIIDPTFQPWIYEVPEGGDLDDKRNWYLANPSLGVTQSESDFAGQWARERRDGTTKLAFQRLKYNMWTDSENSWISPESWMACKGNPAIPDGAAVTVSCDVGAVRDLTAIVVIAKIGEKYHVLTWGFVPAGYLATRDNVNVAKYELFKNEGSLIVTPGTATDVTEGGPIINKLAEIISKYKVQSIVFDKWNALPLTNYCMKRGVNTFDFRQTHAYYHAPAVEFERMVNRKQIVHDGSELMRWQVGHTYLDRDSKGLCKPTTANPSFKKDNLIAVLMALSQSLQTVEQKPAAKPDVW